MQRKTPNPTWLFGVLTLLAVALPGAVTFGSFSAYRQAAASTARSEALRGEIRRLDEVLTMSARMAATTGEERWITRYNANVDALDAAIKAMMGLAPGQTAAAMVHDTDAANVALVAMETHSFELVRAHHRRPAYALLTSPEYERQKAIYSAGMDRAIASIHAHFARETDRSRSWLFLASLASVLGVTICFVTWALLMRRALREQARLHELAGQERDAAQAANKAKSMFLANMSHELRTPLNAVMGYSELLREGAEQAGREGDIKDHDRVLAAARRLLTLIDDVLDLSKAEAGRIVVKPTPFEVPALVSAAAATVQPAVAARGNRLHVEIPDDLGSALTDEFRLSQCLLNLLSNAAKFTTDGDISLTARRDHDAGLLVFEVADSGIGMTADQLEQLFQPFVQVEAHVSTARGGTGLGLAITRQLARLLGGDVFVRSTPGAGSVFTLVAPAMLGPQQPAVGMVTRMAA